MNEWETIFGEKPPYGYDFDKADFWPMETWSKLTAEHPKIAYRLGIIWAYNSTYFSAILSPENL